MDLAPVKYPSQTPFTLFFSPTHKENNHLSHTHHWHQVSLTFAAPIDQISGLGVVVAEDHRRMEGTQPFSQPLPSALRASSDPKSSLNLLERSCVKSHTTHTYTQHTTYTQHIHTLTCTHTQNTRTHFLLDL